MGAYENPPMIQNPNYGEIFSKNIQTLVNINLQRKQEEAKRKKEEDARIIAAGESSTQYAKQASNIKAGALTENLTDIGLGLADANAKNETAFAKGLISAEEYSKNKSKYDMVLNTLSSSGNTIRQFGEAIKQLDLSSYQENPELIALIDAYNKGAVDAKVTPDGKVDLFYEAPNREIIDVDEKWLTNPQSWNVTEKFNSDEITTDLAKIVQNQINQEAVSKVVTDKGTTITTEERYSMAYGTEDQRMNQIMQNKVIAGLDRQELGSYFMDTVSGNIDANSDQDLNAVLEAQNLTEEQKTKIKEDVANGFWSNRDLSNENITVNSGDILREVAKRKIAREVLGKVKPPKSKVQQIVDTSTKKPAKYEIDMAELKEQQEKLLTNPISQRQWDSVTKPRPDKSYEGGAEGKSTASLDDMSLQSMSQLASKYDFTIVGEPLLDKAGTKEIGFELQDNKTKEKVRIYKSFSVDQVMEELKKAKNVSDNNKVQLP